MSDVKRLEERLTAIERLCAEMEGSREIWKEERRTLGDELMRGVNEKLERFGGMTEKGEWAEAAELKEINREVNQYKTAFEVHVCCEMELHSKTFILAWFLCVFFLFPRKIRSLFKRTCLS